MEAIEKQSEEKRSRLIRSEVAEVMQPVIDLHGIEVKDDRMEFPGISPCVGVPESQLPAEKSPAVILFGDIASITPLSAHVEVLLHSGELYTFSTTDSVITQINTYKKGADTTSKHRSTSARDIADNIWDGLENSLGSKAGKNKT